ncbi:MAG: DUF1517 domain-containing protein [Deltaproteobacteria bacterium]|nr:DUF1517 domain-containing protein [Deltaproteobacteria bacterium]
MKTPTPRRLVTVVTLLLAGLLAVGAAESWARSGGSFGGGFRSSSRSSSGSSSRSFGSSSSRSFGSSSSSSPSRSYGSSSSGSSYGGTRYVPVPVPVGGYSRPYYGGGYRSYGSSGSFVGALTAIVVFIVIIIVILLLRRMWLRGKQAAGEAVADRADRCDVTLVQFGVQMLARPIQDKLEKLADKIDASSEEGLAYALRVLGQELTAHQENVEYVAVQVQAKLALAKAQDQFELWAQNERAKYNREVVRGQADGTRRQQKEWQTDGIRDEDGQLAVAEYFVISLVIATRNWTPPAYINDATELMALLEQLSAFKTDDLVALEVVWSPAAQSDAMSRDDMTSRYPTLHTV